MDNLLTFLIFLAVSFLIYVLFLRKRVTIALLSFLMPKIHHGIRREKNHIKMLLENDLPKNAKILEIGAGSGMNFRFFPSNCCHFTAIEPAKEYDEEYQQKAQQNGHVVDAIHHSTAEDYLPKLDSDKFDLVLFSYSLCHIPAKEQVLRQASRVLKLGGRVVFFEHVISSSLFIRILQKIFYRPWKFILMGCDITQNPFLALKKVHSLQVVEKFDVTFNTLPIIRSHNVVMARKIE